MHRWILLFTLPFLAGCPCCIEGELKVVEGSVPVAPGASIDLAFYWDGDVYSTPDACGGHWYVNGVEGGTEATGTITGCGRYTAPSTPPPEPPLIQAAEDPFGTCADCCPHAGMEVPIGDGS